ncbi:MAG TPA: hypothetical protein VN280_22335 [Variovorax sp.]|nr:hypothetical protein [Variovorax sp.]
MDDTITINQAQLQAALAQWEQDARSGKCLPPAENAALSVEEVASASARHLWGHLQAVSIG